MSNNFYLPTLKISNLFILKVCMYIRKFWTFLFYIFSGRHFLSTITEYSGEMFEPSQKPLKLKKWIKVLPITRKPNIVNGTLNNEHWTLNAEPCTFIVTFNIEHWTFRTLNKKNKFVKVTLKLC